MYRPHTPPHPRLWNPNAFAGNPLDRASDARTDPEFIARLLADPSSVIAPFWRGDPLIVGGKTGWLSVAARSAFPRDSEVVFLGLDQNRAGAAHFGVDAGGAVAEAAPFAEIGRYTSLREAASGLAPEELAMLGHARWLLDWHRRHRFCAACGAPTVSADGGAKRRCDACATEHFPRSDPVAIVLAIHDDACLLGRAPHFPTPFFSALAGYVEACETPEECAVRELKEEAGVDIVDVRYQFTQPWPFPSSMMMGFIAQAASRTLLLDEKEIIEARWTPREEIKALIAGATREDLRLPPRFTIARQLMELWAYGATD